MLFGLLGGETGSLDLMVFSAVCFYVAYRVIIKTWETREANNFRNAMVIILTTVASAALVTAMFQLAFDSGSNGAKPEQPKEQTFEQRDLGPTSEQRKTPEQQENHSESKVDPDPIPLG